MCPLTQVLVNVLGECELFGSLREINGSQKTLTEAADACYSEDPPVLERIVAIAEPQGPVFLFLFTY